MVRFSCFNAHIHRHRPKKTSEDFSQGQIRKDVSNSKSLSSGIVERNNACVDENSKHTVSSALERGWKSEEIKAKVNLENDTDLYQIKHIKKSQSLGDELYLGGRDGIENGTDDGVDRMISPYSPEQNGFGAPASGKRLEGSPSGLYQGAPLNSVSAYHSSDQAFNGSIFPVGDPHHIVKEGHQCYDFSLSGDQADDLDNHTPRMPPVMMKSKSMPNIADPLHVPETCPFKYLAHHSRSSDDLRILDMRQREKSVVEIDTEGRQEQERDYGIHTWGDSNMENFVDDCYDAYGYSSSTNDWIVPAADGLKSRNFLQGESSNQQIEVRSKDFKIKRIEEWVNDLQHISLSEEADALPEYNDEMPRELILSNGITHAKGDIKLTPGMEAAKKYVSSLSASATTAQLVNHGLVAIPFLSAFVGLRVLNLSGNAIVRITAGALPRGLHALNLSKNSISNIEGLRELSRLRVLDMSYNRILRIGHGLASCSALKELYLAGNKISEVEGLHRLLKLAVLDLRFNKISTAKCLGQLAANYNSLQAISLEGNPAQKNVGDEQLRKYLVGLLPHLAYFNRQVIRSSSLKDGAERSVRLGMGTQAVRSDLKSGRKSGYGAAANAHKPSSSVGNHGRRTQLGASHKRSKDRISRLPPAGQKGSGVHESQYVGIGNLRVSNIRSELSIRRSRSEGTLGAL